MTVEEFNYDLPEELIAQTPLKKRDESRLMVLDKETGEIEHKHFKDIVSYLNPGDTLVLNDTKVLPARLYGEKEDTKAAIEVLLLKNTEGDTWECLVKPARRIKEGTVVVFGDGKLKATCVFVGEEGIRHFTFSYEGIFLEVLEELGTMPLPPYIHEQLEDQSRYQTVYAREVGSAAAPTAGLHFTKELLKEIEDKGVHIAYITLHVGLGTFRPVSVDTVEEHEMHSEFYQMTGEVAALLNETKKQGGRIISVVQPGEQEVIIGRVPPFCIRLTSSWASSIMVRSAPKTVSKTLLKPILLRAATIFPSTLVPIGRPKASPRPTRTAGAVWTMTVFSGSERAAQTASVESFS